MKIVKRVYVKYSQSYNSKESLEVMLELIIQGLILNIGAASISNKKKQFLQKKKGTFTTFYSKRF